MSIYSTNFWSYAKDFGKEATLNEVFLKWANKTDININLGKEVFREITAEVNNLFNKKAFPDNQFFNPTGTPSFDGVGSSAAIPITNPSTADNNPALNTGTPTGVNKNNIPEEIDPVTGQPKEQKDTMLDILRND